MSRAFEIGLAPGGLDQLPPPAPGLVRIRAVDNPALGLVAELDGHVDSAGGAVWGQIERPRNLPLTDFAGTEPIVLTIPMLLDRWTEQMSVEPEIRTLEMMLGLHGAVRPAVVIIEGHGIPFAFQRDQSLRFGLSGLSWGDDRRTAGAAGERSFVQLSITATQYTAPSVVTTTDPPARRYYKVTSKKPYTLRAIAKKKGITTKKILSLNKSDKKIPRDVDKRIKAGRKVRVG